MAEEKEDSVLFSLRELKRVSAEPSKPKAAPAGQPQKASVSVKAHEPDEPEAGALVTQALSNLKQRVDEERRRVEEARRRAEEERRLTEELGRLEEEQKAALTAQEKAEAQRREAEARLAKLRGQAARGASVALGEEEPPRPRGVLLRPPALMATVVLVVALVGLAAYGLLRKPQAPAGRGHPLAKGPVRAVVAPPADFGPEIAWLDVGDLAAAPAAVADDPDEDQDRPRRRRPRRRRRASESEPAKSKPKVDLPSKPAKGFIY
jgi:hypothetical protein